MASAWRVSSEPAGGASSAVRRWPTLPVQFDAIAICRRDHTAVVRRAVGPRQLKNRRTTLSSDSAAVVMAPTCQLGCRRLRAMSAGAPAIARRRSRPDRVRRELARPSRLGKLLERTKGYALNGSGRSAAVVRDKIAVARRVAGRQLLASVVVSPSTGHGRTIPAGGGCAREGPGGE
jgi:hypothetical protein